MMQCNLDCDLTILCAMSRDVAIQASSKLSGDWSAPEYTKSLTKEVLQELLPRFPKLDPLVRMRLLLSVMSLPAEARVGMQQELEVLSCHSLNSPSWPQCTAIAR